MAVIQARGSVLLVNEPLEKAVSNTAPLPHVKSTLEEVERRHVKRTSTKRIGKSAAKVVRPKRYA